VTLIASALTTSNTGLGHVWHAYLVDPARIVLIVALAAVASALVSRLARRMVKSLRLVSPLVRATPRGEDRVRTLAGVFGSIFRVVIWVIALLTILGELRINLVPFVATATVVGAAVGFGAQSLVKDFLSGVLILAEDQYGVGEHIVVGVGPTATSGTVQNGDIRTVGNDTENDSQALVDFVVPHGTDLVRAGASAEAAAKELAQEKAWQGVFVGDPTFAGVQAVAADGVTLRIMAWTKPGQHFRAAREMRMRVLERLRRDGVAWVPAPPPPDGIKAD
jgi:small-conductance mechanosensitive channel